MTTLITELLDYAAGLLPETQAYVLIDNQVYPEDTPKAATHALKKLLKNMTPKQQTIFGKAAQPGDTQVGYFDSLEFIAVPVFNKNDPTGVFLVTNPQGFDKTHAAAVEALAAQVIFVLTTESELAETQQTLAIHHEIAHLTTSDDHWESLLTHIGEQLTKLFQADACAITLWDAITQKPRRLAAWGIDPEGFVNQRNRPVDAPWLTEKIVRDMQPVFINDTDDLKKYPTPLIGEYNAKALVGLPLKARGRAIGAAYLLRIHDTKPFSPEKVQNATAALDQLALAIDNQLLLNDTQNRLLETNALLEIAAIAAASQNLDDMLRQVLELCRQILQIKAGAIVLYDEDKHILEYQGGSGTFGFADKYRTLSFPVGDNKEDILVKVFQDGQPQFVNDISRFTPTLQQIARDSHLENVLVAPLRVHDYKVGVFMVAGKPGGFTYSDIGLLMAMGSHVAAALRNTQLLQHTRARLRETEILQKVAAITSATLDLDQMLVDVVAEAANMFNALGAQLLILNRNRLHPHLPSTFGVMREWSLRTYKLSDSHHYVKVFHSREPHIANDPMALSEPPHFNVVTVPLNTQQGAIGVMTIIRKQGFFTQAQAQLASAIGNQIATGMQSNQLYASERQRADLMHLINRIAQDLSATLDQRGLMRKVVSNIHEALGYDTVHIFLLDDTGKTLICQASTAANADHMLAAGFTLPVEKGIVSRAVRERKSFLVPDMRQDPDYVLFNEKHENLRSALAVPIKHGGTVYGAIELLGLEENTFTENDLMALESLATQISIAFDNAKLYNQAQRRLLEQGIVHQIGQDLTAILEYNELVNAVARHMTRALDTSTCSVALYDYTRERIRIEADYRLSGTEDKDSTLGIGQTYQLAKFHAAREAITSRRAVTTYVDDTEGDANRIAQLQVNNALSELIVPMTIGDRVIGIVRWAENRRPRRFSREDERLAQTLIAQAAIAIENARLYREAERSAYEQALISKVTLALTATTSVNELIELFTEHVHDALGANNTLIAMIDESGKLNINGQILTTRTLDQMALTRIGKTEKIGRQILKALEAGISIFTTSNVVTQTAAQLELSLLLEGISAAALVPIMYRAQVIGVVEVSTNLPASFDLDGVMLLETLNDQAAVAIDNLRLSEREQRRLRQMERLQESSRLISSELVMQNLLDLVVQEAAATFDVPAVAVLMPDRFGLHYVIHAAHGLSEKFLNKRSINIENSAATMEALNEKERRKPIYYANFAESIKNKRQAALITDEGIQSAMVVPLVKGSKMFGMLEFYTYDSTRRFRDEDFEVTQLLASQIAVALDNADLYLASEERARELAEANRLKSQFLANISHELRTPMNSILGFSEAILSGIYGELTEQQISRLQRIYRNGKNLLALIDDLLDISKIDAGRMEIVIEKVNIRDEVQQALQAIENQTQEKNLYLEFNAPDDLPYVQADTLRLRQIIINLLGNALKFTREGGITVTLETRREVVLAPKPGKPAYQDVVWVSVADTGIGVSLEDQLIIFDEFRQADGSTTREFGGTGLGLAICKRLIELMDGRIWVDSEVGKGSTFTFVLLTAEN